jgi:carnitine 3-dehydrogenase
LIETWNEWKGIGMPATWSPQRVAIVGTGLIGASWAAWLAGQGVPVHLFDSEPSALLAGYERAARQLDFLRQRELVAAGAVEDPALLRPMERLEEAVAEVDLVMEAVAERYEVKIPLFAELDRLTPGETLLASSTSGLLISRMQADLRHPERVLIAHPFNPVHLVPLVELVGGSLTSPKRLDDLRSFLTRHGKTVVVLRKEVPGFIGNRLQAAVWREAIQLVLDGVGSVADIDRALSAGPGIRWALMGQHQIFHLGGGSGGIESFIDHIGSKWSDLWSDMADWHAIPPEARDALGSGIRDLLGNTSADDLTAWRDTQLADILQHLTPPPTTENPKPATNH